MIHTHRNHRQQDQFGRFIDQFFGGPIVNVVKTGLESYKQGILVNTFETDEHYSLQITVPGFAKEDIKISVLNDQLTIAGEHKDAEVENTGKVHTAEWLKAKFSKTYALPKDADASQITASQEAGVLKIVIAKVEKPKAQEITVL
jgi:HSP20 family protein